MYLSRFFKNATPNEWTKEEMSDCIFGDILTEEQLADFVLDTVIALEKNNQK
jgi:hypothetical protein